MRMRNLALLLTAVPLLQGCGAALADYDALSGDGAPLQDAMGQLTEVMVYDIFSPPQASRAYAYASIAAYESLRHGDATYRTMAGQVNGLDPVPAPDSTSAVHLPLAGVHAFMSVGRALTFSRVRMDSLVQAMHARFRKAGVPAVVFDSSVAYGDRVARHILDWASKDNFLQTRGYPKYTVTPESGRWTPTPPAYMDAVEPHWARIRPFAMDSATQYRPRPPLPYDVTPGSPFFRQVREVYDVSRQMTPEQREIAAFWDCNPYVMHVRGHAMFATKKLTPGGHWMGIAGIAASRAGASLVQLAETYARTSIALADGFISSWEEKYRSNLVRPEALINALIDEGWEPLLQTPPFPEYTSGHSVISTAAAVVLTHQFGPDFFFVDSTEVAYGLPVRAFASFEKAAAEAAISRLYGGIHYRMAIEEGVVQGRRVGEHAVRRIQTRSPVVAVRGDDSEARLPH